MLAWKFLKWKLWENMFRIRPVALSHSFFSCAFFFPPTNNLQNIVNWRGVPCFFGEGNGIPLQYSCLENPMDRGAWLAVVHGSLRVRHDWATSLSFSLSGIGEGNGNPLQCSCLENPRGGGAWWTAVYGVAQSRTWLKRLSSSSPVSLPFSTLGAPRPPGTYNLSPGDTSTFLALMDPAWSSLTGPKTYVKSLPQVGKLIVVMTPCVPISWDLCILSLNPSRTNTISEWNEYRWNFRHHVMAAVTIIFGQGSLWVSLRMYYIGSCPAHSVFPCVSSGEWGKKKSWCF